MSQTGTTSHAWPLLFKHHGTILGKGFLADIEIHGRVLATPEADGVWIDGVNPGAISLGAATLNDTHAELRSTLARVFIDFAEQTAARVARAHRDRRAHFVRLSRSVHCVQCALCHASHDHWKVLPP